MEKSNYLKDNKELIKEYNYEKNKGIDLNNITLGSSKKIWWKCSKCGSSFETSVEKRIRYSKCPYCSAKKVNETNSLASKYPNLMQYWDSNKNKNIIPSKTYFSSRKTAWWKCEECGKSYSMSICSRIKAKTNLCFDCKHKHIGNMNRLKSVKVNNSLFAMRKDLLKEWNYERNNPLTPQKVSRGSGMLVWWTCSKCGNEWQAKVFNRVYGTGCPICSRKKIIIN